GASAATLALAHEGVAQLRASIDTLPAIEDSNADVLAETVSLFALHVFINSAGMRYLPMLSEREFVLLETHAEGDDAPSGLLHALGLERRRAVARDEIEQALLRRGGDVVGRMGLDPRAARIVCVPPDVYMGDGPSRGWGTSGEWTLFDGVTERDDGRL